MSLKRCGRLPCAPSVQGKGCLGWNGNASNITNRTQNILLLPHVFCGSCLTRTRAFLPCQVIPLLYICPRFDPQTGAAGTEPSRKDVLCLSDVIKRLQADDK